MKRNRVLIVVALLLVVAVAPGFALAQSSPAALPHIAAGLQRFVDDGTIAGAIVLVADRDKILDLGAVGHSDRSTKQPMQTTDIFWIASMTKTFAAATVMMLVDEGKLKLDDPVEKYLPEFKGQMVQVGKAAPQPASHPITIREVMSHTAGLRRGAQPADTLECYVKEMAKLPLEFQPGTKYAYSAGPAVGGRIVEVVAGVSFPQFLQERLLDPLGLKETSFWPSAELASRLAMTHKLNPATKTLEPLDNHPPKVGAMPPKIASQFGGNMLAAYENHFGNPAGGLFSTATDVSRFCQMLLNGGTYRGKTYLSPAAVKELSSLQTADLLVAPDVGYGLGCFVQTKTVPGGPSLGSFGHHGARKTQMWIDPQNQLVMVLMVQCAELSQEQQRDLYATYRQQAIARYGKAISFPDGK